MDEDGKHVYGAGPLYTTRIDGEVPLFIPPGATGASALPPMTLCELFHATAEKYPSRDAVAWRVKDDAPSDAHPYSFYSGLATTAVGSHWDKMTWAQLEQECYIFANACLKMGLESKDACVVMGFNTPQWLIAFHGSVQAGGTIAGSYPTNGIETCEYLGKDCGAKLVLTESWAHGAKFERLLRDKSEKLAKIVVWGDMTSVPSDIAASKEVLSFVDFMAEGRAVGATHGHSHIRQTVKVEEAELKPTQCCCLIYTSGTTGPPKGVMLSHDNLTWDANAFVQFIKDEGVIADLGPDQVYLSYLPLSHIAALLLDFMLAAVSGGSIYFATPDALSGGLLPLLQQTRPTFFFGVPRVWEKIMDAMKAKGAAGSETQKKIAAAAKAVGLARNMGLAESGGQTTGLSCADEVKYLLCKAVVFAKIKATLGLDRCTAFGSGAAPLSKEVMRYFWSIDMPIIEGFGMSETTGYMTSSAFPTKTKLGTVGVAAAPGYVKLDLEKGKGFAPAGEEGHGEVCMRGRNVMMGYLNKEEKTAETFDEARFLRSGDLGKFYDAPDGSGTPMFALREAEYVFMSIPTSAREDTFLRLAITGRIKELIITAGGENVPPVLVEDQVKLQCPMVSNAVLIGDKRKFLSCLLTLRVMVDPETLQPTDKLDANCLLAMQAIGSSATTVAEAKADPKLAKAIQEGIDRANAVAASRAQKVQKFVVLDTELSVPGGELTATQKLKRDVVAKKYSTEIESMY